MNNKTQSEAKCNCSILASYQLIQQESETTPHSSRLKSAKLKILKQLMKGNKCPAGHTLTPKDIA